MRPLTLALRSLKSGEPKTPFPPCLFDFPPQYAGAEATRSAVAFDTVAELLDYVSKTGAYSVTDGDVDFFGASFDEALALASAGWPQGRQEIETRAAKLAAALVTDSRRARRRFAVSGDFPDVPRAIAGEPECMRSRSRGKRHARVIRLAVGGAMLGQTEAETRMCFGARVGAAIDALEASNTRVEVTLLATSKAFDSTGGLLAHAVVLKEAHDPLDLDRLAYALCHRAFFRRLIGAARERSAGMENGLEARTVVLLPDVAQAAGYDFYWPPCASDDSANLTMARGMFAALGIEGAVS